MKKLKKIIIIFVSIFHYLQKNNTESFLAQEMATANKFALPEMINFE